MVIQVLGLGGFRKLVELLPAECLRLILRAEQLFSGVPQRASETQVLNKWRCDRILELEIHLADFRRVIALQRLDKGIPLFAGSDAEVVADELPDGMLPTKATPFDSFHFEPFPLTTL
jgi:hypothetical protein